MNDGSQQGVGPDRALKTILGGEPQPEKTEERLPSWWLEHLANRSDSVDGYDAHAEVMAKYIIEAYQKMPGLTCLPSGVVYLEPTDWSNPVVLVSDLSSVLKDVYTDEGHPFRRALDDATGFTWGWAYNIARYALGLPSQANPALMTIGEKE